MQAEKVRNQVVDAVVTLVVGAMSSFWLDGALANPAPVPAISV